MKKFPPEEEKIIKALAKDPEHVYDRLIDSFAPHIQRSKTLIKEAILLLLIVGSTQRAFYKMEVRFVETSMYFLCR